jgi:myosin heavy subunit
MEAVRIASAGYPSRTPYKNFYARYARTHSARTGPVVGGEARANG